MLVGKTAQRVGRLLREYRTRRMESNELFDSSAPLAILEAYVRACKTRPINGRSVLYESFFGRAINDNPHAVFRALLDDPAFSSYQHFWVLDGLENRTDTSRYEGLPNVHFVLFGSVEYVEALATCKYLINNVTFPPYFCKRKGQVYVNTWHGTAMKNMGYDMVDGIVGSANMVRNFLHTDYLISANDMMTHMYLDSYKLQGIYPGSIVEEGYPRVDLTLHSDVTEVVSILRGMGVDIEPGKRVVMYAPTWRESKDGAAINPEELLFAKKVLESKIDREKYQVLIKPHQFVYNMIKDMPEYRGVLVPSTVDTNELLSVVDVLISDFSSIIFDFMVLDRPILFYIPDLEGYRKTRGLSFSLEDLPGPHCDNLSDIAELIPVAEEQMGLHADAYRRLKERVCPYDDGEVSKRIVDIVFKNGKDYRKVIVDKGKTTVLLSGGELLVNGIIRSLTSLAKQIDYSKYDVTIFFLRRDPSMDFLLAELPRDVRVLIRTGWLLRDRDEDAVINTFDNHSKHNPLVRMLYPDKVFRREYRRCFGDVVFDCAVDFNGYVRHMANLVVESGAKRRVVWLHNDIYADMNKVVNGVKKNYVALRHTVSLFRDYDRIISCGKQVMVTNRGHFATWRTYDKFGFAHNTVDAERINRLLEESPITVDGRDYYLAADETDFSNVRIVRLPDSDLTSFINIGRFSTEKNQSALISAFSVLHKEYPNTELFILGDGPLRTELEATILELGLGESVHLTGNVDNPFMFMSRANCFVLPSMHEGQPLSVLEARACQLPIILSNFETAEDVLMENGQLLIKSDVDSIADGMRAFMKGKVPTTPFSCEEYNRSAYREFETAIS